MAHWSSCAIHNAPALPVGPCDCGDDAPMTAAEIVVRLSAERQRKIAERSQELIGFYAQLTDEQKKAALEYRGDDC